MPQEIIIVVIVAITQNLKFCPRNFLVSIASPLIKVSYYSCFTLYVFCSVVRVLTKQGLEKDIFCVKKFKFMSSFCAVTSTLGMSGLTVIVVKLKKANFIECLPCIFIQM